MINKPVRMLAGAAIGTQVYGRARGAVPAQFQSQGDLFLLAGAAVYLMWSGRPNEGALGDVLDGVAVGVGAIAAAAVVPIANFSV